MINPYEEVDKILTELINKEINQWEARKKLFPTHYNSYSWFILPDESIYAGTIVETRLKKSLDVHWCLGKIEDIRKFYLN